MHEVFGRLSGLKVAYVGDANNVACSLAIACGLFDIDFVLAAPPPYQFDAGFVAQLRAKLPNAPRAVTDDPQDAVRDAHVIYTDVWTSMGQETEQAERTRAFKPFQVNTALMRQAPSTARFMHCLPARRGEEVSSDVIDGPQSIVVAQAANRLHAQKGLLAWLLDAQVS
jgi:ornithine carbamoyltransferase